MFCTPYFAVLPTHCNQLNSNLAASEIMPKICIWNK